MYKNGVRLDCAERNGNNPGLPPVMVRPHSFIGKSNWYILKLF